MAIPEDRKDCLPLGDCSLSVCLDSDKRGIERMRVTKGSAETRASGALPWDDVIAALAAWPGAGSTDRDWTRHPAFPDRGTAFQRDVWSALCRLAPGETVGYGELARRIGRPGAARAVGQAVGANPWAPLVPCHRVLAGDGSLGGYTGGTAIKTALLAAEGVEARSD